MLLESPINYQTTNAIKYQEPMSGWELGLSQEVASACRDGRTRRTRTRTTSRGSCASTRAGIHHQSLQCTHSRHLTYTCITKLVHENNTSKRSNFIDTRFTDAFKNKTVSSQTLTSASLFTQIFSYFWLV